jgi:alanine dehydrogenase
MTLYLRESDVAELLSTADVLEAVESSFQRLARGVVDNRPRQRLRLEQGQFAVMACVDHELGYAGLKSYAWTLGGTPFVVLLFSIENARLEAVIEADKLGQLRTGAASGIAARYLAKDGATSLGVIGCGWQAESQVASIRAAVPSITRVAEANDCEPVESNREAAEHDIVVTVTTSKDPVLRGEWLSEGALVCAVGANDAARRELDNVVLERAAFVCCDSREQSKIESGDLIEPVERGVLDWLEVHELQEVVAGEVQGRAAERDIVLFKSNGLAAWDLAAGARLVELARARSAGVEL